MKKRILSLLPLVLLLAAMLCTPAFALTEAEVEAQVAASSKAAVTGNVLIWFLCAVAFLKVSQKIDSFLSSLGINAGRTGGSLMAEALVAVRGVSMLAKAGGGAIGAMAGGRQGGSSPGTAPTGSTGGFFKGGLIGMAGRHITNSAVKTATTQTSAVHTAQKQSTASATSTASTIRSGGSHTPSGGTNTSSHTASSVNTGGGEHTIHSAEHTGSEVQTDSAAFSDAISQQEGVIFTGHEAQSAIHTDSSTQTANSGEQIHTQGGGTDAVHSQGSTGQPSHTSTHVTHQTSIGGAVFARSLASGGKFANDVIGSVARGEVPGTITGTMAAQSLHSYLGYTASGKTPPIFSNPEIGRGRITGSVSTPDHPKPIAFGMYSASVYAEPKGPFSKVRSVDGSLWYTQLAQDTVERKPYKAPDGKVAYEESIVKKLPDPPKRKDRI